MNFDELGTNRPKEAISQSKMEALKKLKTPEELFAFMRDNIRYGFVGKGEGARKIYSPEQEGWGEGKPPEIEPQSPEDVLESCYGTCWEQTEIERKWFSEHDFEFKTFLLMSRPEISQKNPAHTFLAFRKDDKWYWFENTLDVKDNGIQEFDSLDDLTEDVKTKIINNAVNAGATDEDITEYKLLEYDTPAFGLSTEEFISQVIEKDKKNS